MKSGTARQERLTKQNQISRQKLERELTKLERMEKSDLRMLETARHRFWSRHKKLEAPHLSTGSSAIDVQMYETHNPGFCYHRTGAMKESSAPAKGKVATDSYDIVCSMLFTNGKVDPEKVVCLHLLAAHCPETINDHTLTVRPIASILEKGKHRHFTGAWNNILPCYVVNRRHVKSSASGDLKLHENPRQIGLEEQAMRDFEEKYRHYVESNSEHGMAISANAKLKNMAPARLGKMPIISPHVYSLLGASHELKVRQALAEDRSRKRGVQSSHEFDLSDAKSHSLRLDNDDQRSSGCTDDYLTGRWGLKSSGRLTLPSSFNLNPDITMLKHRHEKSGNRSHRRDSEDFDSNESLLPRSTFMKKSNFKAIKETPSEVSTIKSHFHNIFDDSTSVSTLASDIPMSGSTGRKSSRHIYLNSPVRSIELRNKNYKTVRILVNYQTQALVHLVLEVLQRVNPEKMRRIIEIARHPDEIKRTLNRPEMQIFLESLKTQSLITSPENFVVSAATLVDEIDPRLEVVLEKEIIAFTLDAPKTPVWDEIIDEVQDNIFHATDKVSSSNSKTTTTCSINDEEFSRRNVNDEDNLNSDNISTDIGEKTLDSNQRENQIYDSENLTMNCSSIEGNQRLVNAEQKEESHNVPQMVEIISSQRVNENISTKNWNSRKKKTDDSHSQNSDSHTSAIKIGFKKGHKGFVDKCVRNCAGIKTACLPKDQTSRACHFKFRKPSKDCHCAEADRIILKRLTNSQRILVGQACASLKTRKINNEGLIQERIPLAAFIAPALSRETIKVLTRGTIYSKKDNASDNEEEQEENVTVATTITGSVLAKLRQEIATNETEQRLKNFLGAEI